MLESAFQRLPRHGIAEEILRFQDEESAIGFMHRPGLNLGEVGGQHPHVVLHFDHAHEVVVGGVRLANDRGALGVFVVDKEIDLVADVPRLFGSGTLFFGPKVLEVL